MALWVDPRTGPEGSQAAPSRRPPVELGLDPDDQIRMSYLELLSYT